MENLQKELAASREARQTAELERSSAQQKAVHHAADVDRLSTEVGELKRELNQVHLALDESQKRLNAKESSDEVRCCVRVAKIARAV